MFITHTVYIDLTENNEYKTKKSSGNLATG